MFFLRTRGVELEGRPPAHGWVRVGPAPEIVGRARVVRGGGDRAAGDSNGATKQDRRRIRKTNSAGGGGPDWWRLNSLPRSRERRLWAGTLREGGRQGGRRRTQSTRPVSFERADAGRSGRKYCRSQELGPFPKLLRVALTFHPGNAYNGGVCLPVRAGNFTDGAPRFLLISWRTDQKKKYIRHGVSRRKEVLPHSGEG